MRPIKIHNLLWLNFDPVAKDYPPCLRPIVATAKLDGSEALFLGSLLKVMVSHAVQT